jgi:NAD(P)H-dependent flavin oxidoreductase YrpB (nitropropane dioxygenase family)
MKGGIEFDPAKVKINNFPQYGILCGWALALAHAKSSDPAILSGYMGNSDELDEAISRFAFSYADQTEKDHAALAEAAKSGRIMVAGESE